MKHRSTSQLTHQIEYLCQGYSYQHPHGIRGVVHGSGVGVVPLQQLVEQPLFVRPPLDAPVPAPLAGVTVGAVAVEIFATSVVAVAVTIADGVGIVILGCDGWLWVFIEKSRCCFNYTKKETDKKILC